MGRGRGSALPLRPLKRRERSLSLDRKPLHDANDSQIPDSPPEDTHDPAPNSYASHPAPIQNLPTVSDIPRELRPQEQRPKSTYEQVIKCRRIEDPSNPNPPDPRRIAATHHILRSPQQAQPLRYWLTYIIPILLLSITAILITFSLYRNQRDHECLRLDIADSRNLQCGDYVDGGAQSMPKCHGLSMMRIGNATAKFDGLVWRAWTFAYAFGEETFACASFFDRWECREVGCVGEECEGFGNVCVDEGARGEEDEDEDENDEDDDDDDDEDSPLGNAL
ncbi:uncharacterized protein MYCFIDRAFT_197339 [Pseudocercospora fijiensis CIRAD86]|uniref:Uncharacterized protein n=1 Tax=Pseudocercospora fijiensis (strain CIRAD86) TaxID=383855 RepID=M3AY93_PSEFD|nr:uncharacterized protein MYCFIDRAFT_197339 [Pseudocercospora fijiensis CIRAD86]EME82133.1 hypothetical protein MYCFIDRAFT_197339 [Pseudocercospora fijiensis CIRAD86]